jgi:tRNA A37 threonylcarbamoyladenosine biosynthesis protein TsaE
MMRVPQTTFSASCKDTDSLVIKFSKLISPNSIIYLNGDVGTGKTYFVKKLAEQFGICDLSSSSYERISIHKNKLTSYIVIFIEMRTVICFYVN